MTMQRLRELNGYQKVILILMAAMVLVFTVLYPVFLSRKGYSYWDSMLVCTQEGENTVYQGKMNGTSARFTVSPDKTVEFHYGEKTYGPYTWKEDPDAVPEQEYDQGMTGIEIRCGDTIFFRGGVLEQGDDTFLYNQDGSVVGPSLFVGDGVTMMDEEGNIIDPIEPSPYTIVELMNGPTLSHEGSWWGWVLGVVICVVTAITILYADELFRFHLLFEISNVEDVEPSGWEMVSRYISWTLLPVLALVTFITGLLYW